MSFLLTRLRTIVEHWPGRKTFGFASFLPVFFGLGAGLEFTMINWAPNGINFYDTYKKSLASSLVDRKEYLAREEAKEKNERKPQKRL